MDVVAIDGLSSYLGTIADSSGAASRYDYFHR